jgi:Uma2 family endonuclease
MLMAPGASGSAARLPEHEPFPRLDEHLVKPETREEMIRGRRVIAMPAHPPHADRHFKLDYVLGPHVKRGYVGSTELLTRAGPGSDFATDTCIRKEGDDPRTGTRYLEELAFEVVNEQSRRDITEKAEDLTARGVRRVVAVFVKTGNVCEWSKSEGDWLPLDLEGTLEDACLSRPIRVKALLDAAEADNAVARALTEKRNPVIEALKAEGRNEGKNAGMAAAILAVLAARGMEVGDEVRARILGCKDAATLDRWITKAATAGSPEEVVAAAG